MLKKSLILGGIILAGVSIWYFNIGRFVSGDITPEPQININGKIIDFIYTDSNIGETLIIKTDKETYGGWENIKVSFSITNNSGKDETVDIQFYFNGTEALADISEFKKDVPYQITVNDYGLVEYPCEKNWVATTTIAMEEEYTRYICGEEIRYCDEIKDKLCIVNNAFIGTHEETRYEDRWGRLNLISSKKNDSLSILSDDYKVSNKAIYSIKDNETKYFQANVEIPKKSQGQFFIEAVGVNGAYGISG